MAAILESSGISKALSQAEMVALIQERFSLTSEQADTINEFMKETPQEHLMAAKYTVEPIEHTCLRFLRARSFDITKAKALLADCFKKKSEGSAKHYASLSPEECTQCDVDLFRMWYPHAQPGFDLLDRPVLFEHSGHINISGLDHITTRDNLVAYHWWTMEHVLDKLFTESFNRNPSDPLPKISTMFVLDLSELTLAHCSPRLVEHLRSLVSLDNTCFPELLGKMVIINAPWIAVNMWQLVKSWLDPRTQAKIEFVSAADTSKKLHELLPADIVPIEYGGRGKSWKIKKPMSELVNLANFSQSGNKGTYEYIKYVDIPANGSLKVDTYLAHGMQVDITVSGRDKSESDAEIDHDKPDKGEARSISNFLSFGKKKAAPTESNLPEAVLARESLHKKHKHVQNENERDGDAEHRHSSEDLDAHESAPTRKAFTVNNNSGRVQRFKVSWVSTSSKTFVYTLTILS